MLVSDRIRWYEYAGVLLAAVVSYVTVTRTFWFHDDWYFLAHAAHLADLTKGGSRWVSYEGYWKLFFPVFGIETAPWAVTRLLLHAGSVWLVIRLARLLGLKAGFALLAGLLFAATPSTFESVFWGTGVVELLGVFFALASLDQWLRGGRTSLILSLLWGVLAVFSKETGFFLPVFYLVWARRQAEDRRPRLLVAGALLGLTVVAGILLLVNLQGEQGYDLTLWTLPHNLMLMVFWMVAPPPFQTGNEVAFAGAWILGLVLVILWLVAALWARRRGQQIAPWAGLFCLGAMLPALPLADHILPRYAYGPAAAGAISLAAILAASGWKPDRRWIMFLVLPVVAFNYWNLHHRLTAEYTNGRVIHRLVVKEEISRRMCDRIAGLELVRPDRLVFFLEPDREPLEIQYIRDSLADDLGLRLYLGADLEVVWTESISPDDVGSYVISIKGFDQKPMGRYRPRRER